MSDEQLSMPRGFSSYRPGDTTHILALPVLADTPLNPGCALEALGELHMAEQLYVRALEGGDRYAYLYLARLYEKTENFETN
jgi:hypothetical protein